MAAQNATIFVGPDEPVGELVEARPLGRKSVFTIAMRISVDLWLR
jgi:hypothetical protein